MFNIFKRKKSEKARDLFEEKPPRPVPPPKGKPKEAKKPNDKCKLCWQCFFNPDACAAIPVTGVVIEEGLYKGQTTDRCHGFKEDL